MGITVEEVLRLPAFKGAKLVSGDKGKSNIVKYVDVIEVPDVENWVKEGEMLLTTSFAMKNGIKAQENLIIKLANVKAAALCIKPGRFIDKIPEKVITIAEKLNFPIIELPLEVPYVNIINQVLSQILNKKASAINTINKIHNSLTDIVLQGEGIQSICNKLCELTGYPIAMFSSNSRMIAFSGEQGKIYHLISQSQLTKEFERYNKTDASYTKILEIQGKRFIVTPIIIEKEIYGFIVMFGYSSPEDELKIKALEQGAIVVALELLKEKNIQEIKKRMMKDLFNDLLEGNGSNPDVLKERGQYYDWNLNEGRQVIILDVEKINTYYREEEQNVKNIQEIKNLFLDTVQITLKKVDSKAIVADKNGRVIVLISIPMGCKKSLNSVYSYTKEIVSNIQKEVTSNLNGMKINIGIGRYYESIENLPRSYKEALEALNLGKKIVGSGKGIHFNDLGIYKLLLDVSDKNQLKDFTLNHLQPLIKQDEQHGTELMATLEAYLRNDKKIYKTAKELFVHRNTVRYRIKKISDILGIDMGDGETLFNIYFSYKALKVVNFLNE